MGELLPNREQIDLIDDLDALYDLRDEVEAQARKIEVDLEFRPGDEEWASRARGALAAHNICFGQLGRRIYRLEKATKPPRISGGHPEVIIAKAAKKEAVASRVNAEVEAKRAKIDADKVNREARLLNVLERTSWLSFFHNAAARLLDHETFVLVSDAATKDQLGRIKHEVRTAA